MTSTPKRTMPCGKYWGKSGKMENAKMNEYEQFKHLLEYFVTHLEWLVNENVEFPGYAAYLKRLITQNNFYATGQGYKSANIQKQIQNWEIYSEGRICITIRSNYGDYKTRKSYLTWQGTGLNVIANWNNNHVESLRLEEYQYWTKEKNRIDLGVCNTLTELGLFDGNASNETLKQFFNKYADLIIDWNEQEKRSKEMEQVKPYIELLKAKKNIILTGAPGTGKTYLAKQIAMAIIGVNSDEDLEKSNQYAFVQFHPSYDYTDFVEGLRPKSDGNNNIGFELKNGIFKDFCKRAIENLNNSKKSLEELQKEQLFSDSLAAFIENIDSEISQYGEFKLYGISGNVCAPIVSINDDSFTTKSKNGNALTTSLKTILSKYEKYKQYQNITWTAKDVSEKLDITYHYTYFFAFLKAFDNFREEHKISRATNTVISTEKKDFMFVIDEINRGEISKIFGELFFSIDPGYRGKKGSVKTQYANLHIDEEDFYVPENVYIIGSMNDIDRSVETFDFAMRRRFTWCEVTAAESAENMQLSDKTKHKLSNLNDQISNTEGLSDAYQIGGAYFLDSNGNERHDYTDIWKYRLESLLKEYLRGLPDSDVKLKAMEDAFNKE